MKISDLTKKTARTPEQAEKEKGQLLEIREKLEKQITELEARIPDETGKAGESILDDMLNGTNNTDYGSIDQLKSEVASKKQALSKANELIKIAEKNVLLARAGAKRREAGKLEKELEKHMEKLQPLLNQLEQLEGVQYQPVKPQTNFGTDVWSDPVSYTISKSETLKRKISQLEMQAENYERQAKGDNIPKQRILNDIAQLNKVAG